MENTVSNKKTHSTHNPSGVSAVTEKRRSEVAPCLPTAVRAGRTIKVMFG